MPEAALSPEVQIKLVEIVSRATINVSLLYSHEEEIKHTSDMFDLFYKSLAKTVRDSN
jgi:hypothetical protein